ncbi:MAG: hypothetical protein DWQ19_11890 [Crenarchaeota archaeon]|nr:MAG: hypothetical protein DWQ19_11890 [Thermoproteota archaeon]
MKVKKVNWLDEKQSLNQAISSGVEFAFLSPDDKQVSPFAFCKDYLQDAVQGYVNKKTRSIYGFTYNPTKHPEVSLTKTKLLVTNSSDVQFKTKVPHCLNFLHQIEDDLKLRKTKVYRCEMPPKQYARCGVWLFEASSRWIKSPPMISMYSLLIRVGFGYDTDQPYQDYIKDVVAGNKPCYQSVDKSRLASAEKGIFRILSSGDKKIFGSKIENNYPSDVDTGTMHNSYGIVGFAMESPKLKMPSWYED